MTKEEGKVIRILDDKSIVINIGSKDGAHVGNKYEIFEVGEKLFDPDTKVELGTLDFTKATVEITKIYDKFSIVKHIKRGEKTINSGLINSLNSSQTIQTTENIKLPINKEEENPMNIKNHYITIGDPVRKVY